MKKLFFLDFGIFCKPLYNSRACISFSESPNPTGALFFILPFYFPQATV